jgi:hypothetical protein
MIEAERQALVPEPGKAEAGRANGKHWVPQDREISERTLIPSTKGKQGLFSRRAVIGARSAGVQSDERRTFLRRGAVFAGGALTSAAGVLGAGAQPLGVPRRRRRWATVSTLRAMGLRRSSSRTSSAAAATFWSIGRTGRTGA